MENEKRDRNEKKPFNKQQCFYFNDRGQLVVESNKGVWVDGEKFVKMYGEFTCNAKTMGETIHQLQGIAVEVGVHETIRETKNTVVDEILDISQHDIMHYCILGADDKRIDEYEKELAKTHWETKKIAELKKELETRRDEFIVLETNYDKVYDEAYSLKNAIKKFNSTPWWKRMFKKVDVK